VSLVTYSINIKRHETKAWLRDFVPSVGHEMDLCSSSWGAHGMINKSCLMVTTSSKVAAEYQCTLTGSILQLPQRTKVYWQIMHLKSRNS